MPVFLADIVCVCVCEYVCVCYYAAVTVVRLLLYLSDKWVLVLLLARPGSKNSAQLCCGLNNNNWHMRGPLAATSTAKVSSSTAFQFGEIHFGVQPTNEGGFQWERTSCLDSCTEFHIGAIRVFGVGFSFRFGFVFVSGAAAMGTIRWIERTAGNHWIKNIKKNIYWIHEIFFLWKNKKCNRYI